MAEPGGLNFSDFSDMTDGATQALGVDLGGGGVDLGSALSNLGGGGGQWDWLSTGLKNMGQQGGKNWWDTAGDWANSLGKFAPIGALGKAGFGAWQAIDRSNQMADYNKAVKDYYRTQGDYVKQQQDYLKAKQQWEQGFMDQFGGAQEEFAGANEEFQGRIADASSKASDVMGQYLAAAKPLLAESQELLRPGVAALARGETPAQWEPILNEARLRGTTAMVQSMVSAGMSPDEARSAAQPVAEQQAHSMLLQLATQMITQGGQLSQVGMTGLGGAGALTEVMGKLAGMGMDAETREFQIMASVLGSILGSSVPGTTMPAPPEPKA
jgi:hypothetical protein